MVDDGLPDLPQLGRPARYGRETCVSEFCAEFLGGSRGVPVLVPVRASPLRGQILFLALDVKVFLFFSFSLALVCRSPHRRGVADGERASVRGQRHCARC